MSFGKRFGQLVRRKREIEGITQAGLALKAHDDEARKTFVSQLENGHIARPQAKTIDAYVVALNISEDELNRVLGKFPRYVENLTDIFDLRGKPTAHVEVAINEFGKALIFCDCNIRNPIRRLEYFVDEKELIFVGEDRMRRGFGAPLHESVAAHMPDQKEVQFFKISEATRDGQPLGIYPILIINDSA